MSPKEGKVFPGPTQRRGQPPSYAAQIAAALQTELGGSHSATKTVMRWTGASQRTAKHWLSGLHGPAGRYLIALMKRSDIVFEAILAATGRSDVLAVARMINAQRVLAEARAAVVRGGLRPSPTSSQRRGNHLDDAADQGIDDPLNDPLGDPVLGVLTSTLNARQRWCLEMLASGAEVRAADVQDRWGVSLKTARRDLAALKSRRIIEYVGSRKTGRYILLGRAAARRSPP